ncbi:hypothetical protein A9Q77_09950 [Marinomonas sp. 42_23_T18]|nr:hypothetical protein A9Q77_09950 [Marinomonas sp. 42_23_T18]
MKLDAIHIYPVKSIANISLDSSQVRYSGLFDDRRYMLVLANGNFITARTFPILTQVKPHYEAGRLTLTYQENQISLHCEQFSQEYKKVKIWGTYVDAQVCGEVYNTWFSQLVGKDVELVYFGDKSQRVIDSGPEQPIAFAEGYPFLIASKASLAALQKICPEKVNLTQFRANLIIDDCEAFAEDTWQRFKIGDVIFESVKPCIRCTLTTIVPETGEFNPQGEPFKTLKDFRFLNQKGKDKGPTFGMNLIALNEGEIKIGDTLEVLSYREAEVY